MIFTGKISNEKIKLADDVSQIKFFKQKDIPYKRIAFTSLIEPIKKFMDFKK